MILVQRYKELFNKEYSGKNQEVPFDIDRKITEIQTDSIDDEYINSKFKIVLKELNTGDSEVKEIALIELHKSFVSLTQEEQKYAKLFLQDLVWGCTSRIK